MKKPSSHNTVLGIKHDRTRFGEIVSEFWAPRSPSQQAIIICDGCPAVPSKKVLGEFLAKKGYWVFHIRYRGTWESEGEFLRYPPQEDVLHVAARLNLGFEAMYSGEVYQLDITEVTVLGTSFGGAVALAASVSPLVAKAIVVAPVINFKLLEQSSIETLADFTHMLQFGFPGAYRGDPKLIRKLLGERFLNPLALAKQIDPRKVLAIQAIDDTVCPPQGLKRFCRITHVKAIYIPSGGHLSSSVLRRREVWKQVREFLTI